MFDKMATRWPASRTRAAIASTVSSIVHPSRANPAVTSTASPPCADAARRPISSPHASAVIAPTMAEPSRPASNAIAARSAIEQPAVTASAANASWSQ